MTIPMQYSIVGIGAPYSAVVETFRLIVWEATDGVERTT